MHESASSHEAVFSLSFLFRAALRGQVKCTVSATDETLSASSCAELLVSSLTARVMRGVNAPRAPSPASQKRQETRVVVFDFVQAALG